MARQYMAYATLSEGMKRMLDGLITVNTRPRLNQKLSVAAPSLISSCITEAPEITTPSSRSSSL